MKSRAELVHHLRDHIVAGLHTGQLNTGDRLPSIREVAEEVGNNERTVAAAYRALQAERLVEIRGRSGVYVAPQQLLVGETPAETATWLAGVLTEAWKRRIAAPKFFDVVRNATSARTIRCGLVDVVEDGIVAFRHELSVEWGLDVHVMGPDLRGSNVDFYATTSFYAAQVHDAVQATGKPLLLLTINPALRAAIERQLASGVLTVVAMDPRFAERMRVAYEVSDPEKVRLVLATDDHAVRSLDPNQPVLMTRAARQHVRVINAPLLFPHSPTLSTETARAVATLLVRLNLQR